MPILSRTNSLPKPGHRRTVQPVTRRRSTRREILDLLLLRSTAKVRFNYGCCGGSPKCRIDDFEQSLSPGGKGGVGKTTVSCNLAIAFAQRGARVVLLDGDFGLANADVVLGLDPRSTLESVLGGMSMNRALTPGPFGLQVLAGCSGLERLANLEGRDLERMHAELATLENNFDILILDTAAGVHESVLNLLESADDAVMVVTEDPLSALDAFATVKLLRTRGKTPRISLLVNRASALNEGRAFGEKLRGLMERSIGVKILDAGVIRMDSLATTCLRARKPMMIECPKSAASQDIYRCAKTLLAF